MRIMNGAYQYRNEHKSRWRLLGERVMARKEGWTKNAADSDLTGDTRGYGSTDGEIFVAIRDGVSTCLLAYKDGLFSVRKTCGTGQ